MQDEYKDFLPLGYRIAIAFLIMCACIAVVSLVLFYAWQILHCMGVV